MKKGFTKIVFVIDRSGSMASVKNDMIGGFNTFIKTQQEAKVGECRISFYQFDDIYEEVYKNLLVENVKDLDSKTYVPRNGTSLLDAVGMTINNVTDEINKLPEEEKPEKILVVILTDGEENSSQMFAIQDVRQLITEKTLAGWEFVYIGANQDTWNVAASMGIGGSNSISYVSKGKNTKSSNESLWGGLADKAVMYRSNVGTKMCYTLEEQQEQQDLIDSNTP
jgi:uncharacterized protein YegL